jgi:hypothetical protein
VIRAEIILAANVALLLFSETTPRDHELTNANKPSGLGINRQTFSRKRPQTAFLLFTIIPVMIEYRERGAAKK